jgi:hypothetical protein
MFTMPKIMITVVKHRRYTEQKHLQLHFSI